MMWDTGFMAWRIGHILDFDAQIVWVRDAGFESFSFHASSGVPGRWRGIDPATADRTARERLRDRLAAFSACEVHAPFAVRLTRQEPLIAVESLAPIVAFAGHVGASVVTVHPEPSSGIGGGHSKAWLEALDRLDAMAGKAGVVIGVETLGDGVGVDFGWLAEAGLENVGVTLDVGHMVLNAGAPYRPYGTIGGLVRHLANLIVHMHVHDHDGTHDHLELGKGEVDWLDVLRSAAEIGYSGALCLELNPDRVTPEGILRSRGLLLAQMARLGAGDRMPENPLYPNPNRKGAEKNGW
jgi:sugar phosphate isomerase/epimerase